MVGVASETARVAVAHAVGPRDADAERNARLASAWLTFRSENAGEPSLKRMLLSTATLIGAR